MVNNIIIIDYGAGNLRSVQKSFEFIGFPAKISSDCKEIERASHLVFPGNGAFGKCMKGLEDLGIKQAIDTFIKKGNPFLGLCIGLQALFDKSFEFGEHNGLGYISGKIKRFPEELLAKGFKIPQIGWNSVYFEKEHRLFKNIPNDTYFYFIHSFYAECNDKCDVIGRTEYGIEYTSAVSKENIHAVQFHPEKSQKYGLEILKNFCNM